MSDKYYQLPNYSLSDVWKASSSTSDTSDHQLQAAPGAGRVLWITKLTVTNRSAVNTMMTFKNGAGGSTVWQTPMPANGGAVEPFPTPIDVAANTALYFAASDNAATLYVSAAGFTTSV